MLSLFFVGKHGPGHVSGGPYAPFSMVHIAVALLAFAALIVGVFHSGYTVCCCVARNRKRLHILDAAALHIACGEWTRRHSYPMPRRHPSCFQGRRKSPPIQLTQV